MWTVSRRSDGDYAPSRMAYRANRFWLSPMARVLCLWILPLCALLGWGTYWVAQPDTQNRLKTWQAEVVAHLKAQEEFQLTHLAIQGASPELAREIRRTAPVAFPVSVLDAPLDEVRKAVAEFHAVAHVTTHVEMGGLLVVTVTEREPVVIWRNRAGLDLLDLHGNRVANTDRRDGAPELPLIVAEGADRAIPEALTLFAAAAPISDRVRGLRRMGERRWDLVLTDDVVVQLPAENPVRELNRVIGMHEAGQLLDKDISHVDMRNPDRPTIRLGSQALGIYRTKRAFQ